jgi:hypothetical protein
MHFSQLSLDGSMNYLVNEEIIEKNNYRSRIDNNFISNKGKLLE